MRETAKRRLHQGSLKLKLLRLLRYQLLIKTALLVYYLMTYIPCLVGDSIVLDSVFLYSEVMCGVPAFSQILMPIELVTIACNILVLLLLRINLP